MKQKRKRKLQVYRYFIVNVDDDNEEDIQIINIIVIILNIENLKLEGCLGLIMKFQVLSNYNYRIEKVRILLY